MKPPVKICLYVLSVALALIFGLKFAGEWRRAGTVRDQTRATATDVTPEQEAVPTRSAGAALSPHYGRMLMFGLLTVVAVVGVGVLVAHDSSRFMAQRALKVLGAEEVEPMGEVVYEEVEKAWSNGDFLGAINLLREFVKRHPRAVHANLRIAEIYEKDLQNPLASALEYEEVLKHRLEPDRWGWTAIHLVKLYNRLDRPAQAVALLQRVVAECPDTPSANKARERLEGAGIEVPEPPAPGTGAASSEAASEPSGPKLPPGFRPKHG